MTLRPEFKKNLSKVHLSMVLLWTGFVTSVVSLFFIPESIFVDFPVSRAYPYLVELEKAIWIVALAFALFLLWAKKRFYSIEAIFEASKRPFLLLDLQGETPAEKGAARLVYFYKFRMALALIASESIGICGLLLTSIAPHGWEGRLFYLTSAAFLALYYPSRAFFNSLIQQYEHREMMYELDGRWGRS